MAGKRPDQHNIAPGEAGATDYKRHPQTTHGQDSDMDTMGDKQRLAESQKAAKGQPFPPDVPAPSEHVKRAQEDDGKSTPPAARSKTGRENPLS